MSMGNVLRLAPLATLVMTRPVPGIDHLTVVPENFVTDDEAPGRDRPGETSVDRPDA